MHDIHSIAARTALKNCQNYQLVVLVGPPPTCDFGFVDAVLVGIVPAVDLHVAKLLFRVCANFLRKGTRSIASIARLKRSISLAMANSSGVLILHFSLNILAHAGSCDWCGGTPNDELTMDNHGS